MTLLPRVTFSCSNGLGQEFTYVGGGDAPRNEIIFIDGGNLNGRGRAAEGAAQELDEVVFSLIILHTIGNVLKGGIGGTM